MHSIGLCHFIVSSTMLFGMKQKEKQEYYDERSGLRKYVQLSKNNQMLSKYISVTVIARPLSIQGFYGISVFILHCSEPRDELLDSLPYLVGILRTFWPH